MGGSSRLNTVGTKRILRRVSCFKLESPPQDRTMWDIAMRSKSNERRFKSTLNRPVRRSTYPGQCVKLIDE